MSKNFNKIKYCLKNQKKGMTLIELLVVIAIFTMISSFVMYDYGNFRSTTSTQNLANDIALSIRKAQSSAIGVRSIGSDFQYGHGIHFTNSSNMSNSMSGSNKSFILFKYPKPQPVNKNTNNSNNHYNSHNSMRRYNYSNNNKGMNCGNPQVECEEIVSIKGPDEISTISLNGNPQSLGGSLDIVFERPNPDALFCYRDNVNSTCQTDFSSVQIKVSKGQKSKNNLVTRTITVWNTGQISVN